MIRTSKIILGVVIVVVSAATYLIFVASSFPHKAKKDFSPSGLSTDDPRKSSRSSQPSAAEAILRMLGENLGVPWKVLGEPELRGAGAPSAGKFSIDAEWSERKTLASAAEALGVPLVAESGAVPPTELHLTKSALVVGDLSPLLANALNRLGSDSPEERSDSIWEIRQIDAQRTEGLFVSVLERDSNSGVRAEAASALGEASSVPARAALLKSLGDEDPWVRDNARLAIESMGPEKMKSWLEMGLKSEVQAIAYESADLLESSFGLPLPEDYWFEYLERDWGEK